MYLLLLISNHLSLSLVPLFLGCEEHHILTNCRFFVQFKVVEASLSPSWIFRAGCPDGAGPLLWSVWHIHSIGTCVTASPPRCCSAPEAEKTHMLEPSSRAKSEESILEQYFRKYILSWIGQEKSYFLFSVCSISNPRISGHLLENAE